MGKNASIEYGVDGYLCFWKASLIVPAEGVVRFAPVVRFTPLSPRISVRAAKFAGRVTLTQ